MTILVTLGRRLFAVAFAFGALPVDEVAQRGAAGGGGRGLLILVTALASPLAAALPIQRHCRFGLWQSQRQSDWPSQ